MMTMFCGSFTIGNGQELRMNKIIINIPSRTLTYYEGTFSKTYPVAVGKPATKTPTGNFSILNKAVNPYYSRKKIPGGRSDNPLGIRWMGFKGNYGIHGNSAPNSIGTTASAGCVRMFNYDVKELYDKVAYKTKVEVTYDLFQILEQDATKERALVIYPDVYNREKNLKVAMKKQLDVAGLSHEKELGKIDEAIKLARDRVAVIAKNWTLVVNQQYVSTAIIKEGTEFYIGEDVLARYFGLTIDKTTDELLSIQGAPVDYKTFENNRYVALGSLQNILKGNIMVNDTIENLWYDVSFVKLNGRFLEVNDSNIASHKPTIPIQKLSEIISSMQSPEKPVEIAGNQGYMDIEEAQSLFGFQYDIHSVEKKIELFIQPPVTFERNNLVP